MGVREQVDRRDRSDRVAPLAQAHHVHPDRRGVGNQQLDAGSAVSTEVETRREHADDPERLRRSWTRLGLAVNQAPDRVGIRSEAVAPQP